MLSKTVEGIHQNALRLLADAELLYLNDRYESATALSVLSMEEAGKACLVRWKEEGRLKGDLAKHIRQSHFDKQRILYCYHWAKETLLAIANYYEDGSRVPKLEKRREDFESSSDYFRYIWRSMLLPKNDEDLISFLSERVYDKTDKYAYTAETGIIDTFKQIGFYKDIDENMELTLPSGVPNKACADSLMALAEVAVKMPTASEHMHLLMAVRYSQGPVYGTPNMFFRARPAGLKALREWAEEGKEQVASSEGKP
jgi:AbiV family abortive infection protein